MSEDYLVEALTKIANCDRVKKACEPDVFCPQDIGKWHVKRVLIAVELLDAEWKKDVISKSN